MLSLIALLSHATGVTVRKEVPAVRGRFELELEDTNLRPNLEGSKAMLQ